MGFFEKLGDGIASVGKDVADKAKEVSDVVKYNNKIKNDESEITKCLVEIGRAYYEKNKENESDEYAVILSKIKELYADIKVQEDLIIEAKAASN